MIIVTSLFFLFDIVGYAMDYLSTICAMICNRIFSTFSVS